MGDRIIALYRFPEPITGHTSHISGDRIEDSFDELKIMKFGDQEFNLLYFRQGEEVTDTGHGSLKEALDHAEFEFGLTKEDWEFVS